MPSNPVFASPVLRPFVATLVAWAWVVPTASFAQDGQYVPPSGTPAGTTPSGEYVPPTGEKPDYEKVFRPNTPQKDLVLELNPLLLINRGIAVEFEKGLSSSWSLGGDLIYRNASVYDKGGVKGRVQYLGVAPKFRVYPLGTLGGFFFGVKAMLGQNTLEVSGGGEKTEKSVFTISPTAHVGYRFTTFGGFTLAGYVGGGINVPRPELETEDFAAAKRTDPNWRSAKDDVNNATGLFRPDIGFTLGIAL